MVIDNNMTIASIQKSFQDMFGGLKIEFYKSSHEDHEGSKAKDQYEADKTIGDIRTAHGAEVITIDPSVSVGELEQKFHDQLGLNVQVFRRSNTLWLQTSKTDDWSLQEQNRKGLASIQD